MKKFGDLAPGEKVSSSGVHYTKLAAPKNMTCNCKCGLVNANHKGKNGIVQFVFVDEAKLVEPGHVDLTGQTKSKIVPFVRSAAVR